MKKAKRRPKPFELLLDWVKTNFSTTNHKPKMTKTKEKKAMTPEQMKKIRAKLGVTQGKFAEMLGYSSFLTILRKEGGQAPITKQDEIIIEQILKEYTAKIT